MTTYKKDAPKVAERLEYLSRLSSLLTPASLCAIEHG